MSVDNILACLNSSQRAAVSSSAQTLAILAGPGSGKTHTLTSRTAWLLKHGGIPPWNIIVATFTVKAAREMKDRIGKLIGDGMEAKLQLGTFHSIARRYLIRYGHLINIERDFGIADSSDSLAIIRRIVKRHKLTIDPAVARSRISGRKAKGADYQSVPSGKQGSVKPLEAREFEICYEEYEEALKRSNLLDYDDLLLRCVDLLRAHPSCVSNVEAVLIDEFQDTNLVQFDLMRLLAAERKCVTIVGDPDQSIYGFRSAETKNFRRMLTQYPETITVPLEENYRSSGAILLTALEVIQQDEGRIAKSLTPTHIVGTKPVLRRLSSAHVEAQWIIAEIKRCLTLTGNLMTFDDIAILLRSASLSRHIESALGKAGIAYRMVGGHRFYDHVEVKIILDYLRVINQPGNNDALARVINVPPRRIGDTTIRALLEEAEKSGISLWKLVLESVQGIRNTKAKLAKLTEQGLSSFVNLVLTARKKISDHTGSQFSIVELVDFVIKKTLFEDFLEKSHPEDCEARWANVRELINQATDFSDLNLDGEEDDEALPEVDGLIQDELSNPLSKFLGNIALASAVDAKSNDAESSAQAQVTISTIHAAKGLEWPVVFIPATYEGSIPHSRSEDADEERRLLYVAMTRAQALLYMSYPLKNSQREQTTLSPFLAPTSLTFHLDDKGPSFTSNVTQSISEILKRTAPKRLDEQALAWLDSLEDDIWPVSGEDIEGDVKWEVRDGDHYIEGQHPLKRQRVDHDRQHGESLERKGSSYMTTVMQPTTFSILQNNGFTSAGSHMRALKEQSTNSAVEKPSLITDSHRHQRGLSPTEETVDRKPGRKASARATKRSEGQPSLMSFFKPSSQPVAKARPQIESNNVVSYHIPAGRQPFKEMAANYTKRRESWSLATDPDGFRIPPTLSSHRLGSASLRPPVRNIHEDALKNNSYAFLSSSPPRPERPDQRAQDAIPLLEPPEVNTSGIKMVAARAQPMSTLHVTTMSIVSTVNMSRKTLGVRRSMNGWSNRKSQGFAPPIMSKPP